MPESPKPQPAPPRETPAPRTSAELRAYADDLEAQARAAAQLAFDRVLEENMAEVRQVRDAADVVERLEGMTRRRDGSVAAGGGEVATLTPESSLTSEELSVRNERMSSANLSTATILPRGRSLESDGPFARVAKKLKVSVTAVAKAVGVSPATAHVWNNRGKIPNESVRAKLAEVEKNGVSAPKSKRAK